jgi:hypothetical protein
VSGLKALCFLIQTALINSLIALAILFYFHDVLRLIPVLFSPCKPITMVIGVFNSKIVIAEVLSKFGSGLFLLVQVLMLLDFTNNWNDSWVEKDEQKW